MEWAEIEKLLFFQHRSPELPFADVISKLVAWRMVSIVRRAVRQGVLFRKFCSLERGGDVPEASTLGQFTTRLVEHGPWASTNLIRGTG